MKYENCIWFSIKVIAKAETAKIWTFLIKDKQFLVSFGKTSPEKNTHKIVVSQSDDHSKNFFYTSFI